MQWIPSIRKNRGASRGAEDAPATSRHHQKDASKPDSSQPQATESIGVTNDRLTHVSAPCSLSQNAISRLEEGEETKDEYAKGDDAEPSVPTMKEARNSPLPCHQQQEQNHHR
jgi:hypothetical protein